MNWNQDKSVKLSLLCVWVFAVLLLWVDIAAISLAVYMLAKGSLPASFPLADVFDQRRLQALPLILLLFSVPAWTALWQLRKILLNFRRSLVFEADTARHMRIASWCCFGAAAVCLTGGFFFPTLFVLALAAAFMGLIVRIVKNSFEAAIRMKDELDLTI